LVASSIWSTNADTAVGDPSTIIPFPDVKISTGPSDLLAPSSVVAVSFFLHTMSPGYGTGESVLTEQEPAERF
jgi:hypothetical protein